MHLKVWAAVCHPDFSELLFQGIFTFSLTLFIAHMSRPAHTLSLYNRQIPNIRSPISRPSVVVHHFSTPEPKAYGELIGWYSSQRPSVRLSTFTNHLTNQSQNLYES